MLQRPSPCDHGRAQEASREPLPEPSQKNSWLCEPNHLAPVEARFPDRVFLFFNGKPEGPNQLKSVGSLLKSNTPMICFAILGQNPNCTMSDEIPG